MKKGCKLLQQSILVFCNFIVRVVQRVARLRANNNRISKCNDVLEPTGTLKLSKLRAALQKTLQFACSERRISTTRPGSFNSSNIDFLPRYPPGQEVCLYALESGKVCGKRGRKGGWGCMYMWLCESVCPHPSK